MDGPEAILPYFVSYNWDMLCSLLEGFVLASGGGGVVGLLGSEEKG